MPLKFYLASPLFQAHEIQTIQSVEEVLRQNGYEVFSPRENQLPEYEYNSFAWRTHIFRNDVNHIKWADAVIAIVSGNYDDTGTSFEIGCAYAMNKPVYIYNPAGDPLNLMITESLQAYFESIDEISVYDFQKAPIKPYN